MKRILRSEYGKAIGLSLVFGVLFWIVDGYFEYLFLHKNLKFMLLEGPENLVESLFTKVPLHSIFARISFLFASITGGIIASVFLFRKNKLQKDLRQSEETFSNFFSQSNIGMSIASEERTISQVNNKLCYMLGYQREELIGNAWGQMIHPDDSGTEKAEFIRMERGVNDSYEIEIRFLRKDGHIIHAHVTVSCTRHADGRIDRVLATFQDITERKRTEEALKLSHKRFLTILNSIDAIIYVADMETHEILFMNRYMIESFGRDMTGETCWSAFRGASGPCGNCAENRPVGENDTLLAGCEWQGRNPVTGKWYVNYNRAIEWTDGRMVRIQTATDITEMKELESRLQQAQKMEAIGNLAGGIAHDFNNILAPIIGYSELLLEDMPAGSHEHRNTEEILKAGIRGRELVRQILTFSRRAEHQMTPIHIQTVLKEALKLIRSTIPANIEIVQNIDEKCGSIMADPTQVHQIILNLITNASHSMETSGGKISVELREIHLRAGDMIERPLEPGTYAILTVADNGCGIDPAIADKIFEPYFTTKEQGKGTGLGLAITYGIAKELKGDIKVYSEVGTGTSFNLYLPIIDETTASRLTDEASSPRTGDERILLVDDEGPIAEVGKKMLERLGYAVTAFTDSIDGLKAFRADPSAFDLVISDMTMPNMTGNRLAQELLAVRPDIPIIICTGFSERINEENIAAAGIKGFLMKPVVVSEMAKMVRSVLDHGKDTS